MTLKVREVIAAFVLFKGTTVAVVTFIIGTAFWQSLVIAATSGFLGLCGMLGAAYIAGRESGKTRARVDDVARKVDASRRKTDPNGADC